MSIEEVRTSFEKFKEAFDPTPQESPLQAMPRELLGVNPGWVEDVLGMLSGDLNYDRIAKVKQKLRDGLDAQRFVRQDGMDARGCLFSGTGRGDCEHFVGLPGKSIPGKHNGSDDTVDEYGRPNEWCEVCWRGHQIKELKNKIDAQKSTRHTPDYIEYSAYLIEAKRRTENGCPVYLRSRGDPAMWTPDVEKAFQFCRKIDAERYAGINDDTWKITEHGFCNVPF